MRPKICILAGGDSNESEISILTLEEILKHIDKEKYNVNTIYLREDNDCEWVREIIDLRPDLVMSALHGGIGENGSVQGLLECLKIKYVGSKVLSSSLCMDKHFSKIVMKANNIPVIEDVFLKEEDEIYLHESDIIKIGYPLIVKPNNGGSSIGISIANNFKELNNAIEICKKMKDDILIEKFIKGREVTCVVVESKKGLKVFSVLDIQTNNIFYDYNAKYENDYTQINFSSLPEYLKVMIQEIAKKCFRVLSCNGYIRVDMIVDDEQIYVIEVNTLPGLTYRSSLPKSISKDENFAQFLDDIIKFGLEQIK